jgi:hypothetical protein
MLTRWKSISHCIPTWLLTGLVTEGAGRGRRRWVACWPRGPSKYPVATCFGQRKRTFAVNNVLPSGPVAGDTANHRVIITTDGGNTDPHLPQAHCPCPSPCSCPCPCPCIAYLTISTSRPTQRRPGRVSRCNFPIILPS